MGGLRRAPVDIRKKLAYRLVKNTPKFGEKPTPEQAQLLRDTMLRLRAVDNAEKMWEERKQSRLVAPIQRPKKSLYLHFIDLLRRIVGSHNRHNVVQVISVLL